MFIYLKGSQTLVGLKFKHNKSYRHVFKCFKIFYSVLFNSFGTTVQILREDEKIDTINDEQISTNLGYTESLFVCVRDFCYRLYLQELKTL